MKQMKIILFLSVTSLFFYSCSQETISESLEPISFHFTSYEDVIGTWKSHVNEEHFNIEVLEILGPSGASINNLTKGTYKIKFLFDLSNGLLKDEIDQSYAVSGTPPLPGSGVTFQISFTEVILGNLFEYSDQSIAEIPEGVYYGTAEASVTVTRFFSDPEPLQLIMALGSQQVFKLKIY